MSDSTSWTRNSSTHLILQPVDSIGRVTGQNLNQVIAGKILCGLFSVIEERLDAVLDARVDLRACTLNARVSILQEEYGGKQAGLTAPLIPEVALVELPPKKPFYRVL